MLVFQKHSPPWPGCPEDSVNGPIRTLQCAYDTSDSSDSSACAQCMRWNCSTEFCWS